MLQVAENVKFDDLVEVGIADGTVGKLRADLQTLQTLLRQYTSIPDPAPLLSNKVKALILDLVHNMDVIDQLVKADVRSVSDWAWFKQLRYYSEPKEGVRLKMVDASFAYTYEYQGNAPKLVHTPLTDK